MPGPVDPRTVDNPLAAMELLLSSITRGDQHIAAAVAQRAEHMGTQPSDNPAWPQCWQAVADRWRASALSHNPADRPRYPRLNPEQW